jgi:hypothetical protein
MPIDPGLSRDNCIFLEAAPGDGGNHVIPQWWLSEDLIVVGSPSGRVAIGANTIRVTTRRKPSCGLTNETDAVSVEAYVCLPGPVINPVPDGAQARRLGLQTIAVPMGAAVAVNFTLNATNNASQPEGFGHRCLIARAYPDDLVPDAANIEHLPEDQHYAQHNICIIECGPPGAAREPGPCGFEGATANENAQVADDVTLRLVADVRPSQQVLNALLPRLNQISSFKRLATAAPTDFQLGLPEFPDAKVTRGKSGCLGILLGKKGQPSYEAQIQLKPAQITRFSIGADLSKSSFGDAHFFHLTQVGADARVQGGLTVVMVVS